MNIEKTKILIIFIAIFICLNILIWFLLSIVKGTLFVYLWDRNTKGLYLVDGKITTMKKEFPKLMKKYLISSYLCADGVPDPFRFRAWRRRGI